MGDLEERVFQDFQVRKVSPGLVDQAPKVILDYLALTDLMECQGSRANEAFQAWHCQLLSRVIVVNQDNKDSPDYQDWMDVPDLKDIQGRLGYVVRTVYQGCRGK